MNRAFRGRRLSGDRGVAIVEMAIVAPFLALLIAGIFEFGTLWRDDLTVETSTRAAARVVSNLGDDHLADYEAILSLNAGLNALPGVTVEGVLIYDGSASDGAPDSRCFDGAGDPRGWSGECNYYSAADLAHIATINCTTSCSEFPSSSSCSGGYTQYYCPQLHRTGSLASGLDSVGVWVRIERDFITGLFPGDGVTISDRTVMRVEPET